MEKNQQDSFFMDTFAPKNIQKETFMNKAQNNNLRNQYDDQLD